MSILYWDAHTVMFNSIIIISRWKAADGAVVRALASLTRRHMWVEFVVCYHPCSVGFSNSFHINFRVLQCFCIAFCCGDVLRIGELLSGLQSTPRLISGKADDQFCLYNYKYKVSKSFIPRSRTFIRGRQKLRYNFRRKRMFEGWRRFSSILYCLQN